MMLAAWLAVVVLRRVVDRYGFLRHVWHPSLFVFAIDLKRPNWTVFWLESSAWLN
jgi:hypothetical protein